MKAKRLLLVVFVVTLTVNLFCQQENSLKPLLIDLPNYKAEAAEGSSMEAMGIKMINASRTYESDDSELTATIVISNKIQDAKMLEDVEVEKLLQ